MIEARLVCIGTCKCIYEPRGYWGLEGYSLDSEYIFEMMEDRKGRYCRIFLEMDYYETCGPKIFTRCFAITESNVVH